MDAKDWMFDTEYFGTAVLTSYQEITDYKNILYKISRCTYSLMMNTPQGSKHVGVCSLLMQHNYLKAKIVQMLFNCFRLVPINVRND